MLELYTTTNVMEPAKFKPVIFKFWCTITIVPVLVSLGFLLAIDREMRSLHSSVRKQEQITRVSESTGRCIKASLHLGIHDINESWRSAKFDALLNKLPPSDGKQIAELLADRVKALSLRGLHSSALQQASNVRRQYPASLLSDENLKNSFLQEAMVRRDEAATRADLTAQLEKQLSLVKSAETQSNGVDFAEKLEALNEQFSQRLASLSEQFKTGGATSISAEVKAYAMLSKYSVDASVLGEEFVRRLIQEMGSSWIETLSIIALSKVLTVSGVVVSSLMAVAIVLIYWRLFAQRLAMLVALTQSIARQQFHQKFPALAGRDEIFVLNRALLDARDALAGLFEQRNHVVEMVSHDIRSPLMSTCVLLDVLAKENSGALQEQISSIRADIGSTVQHAQQLLDSEQLKATANSQTTSSADARFVTAFSGTSMRKLALTAIAPVIIQLVCLVFVYDHLEKTLSAARQVHSKCEIVLQSALLTAVSVQAVPNALLFFVTHRESYRAAGEENIQKINRQIAILRRSSTFLPESQNLIASSEANVAKVAAILRKGQKINLEYIKEVEPSLSNGLLLLDRQLVWVDKQMASTVVQVAALNDKLSWVFSLLLSGLTANIVLAGGLLLYGRKAIKARIDSLVLNALAIPEPHFRQNSIGGTDEFFKLEVAVNAARDRLAAAQNERIELLKGMAQTWRSPLSSASEKVELISNVPSPKLDEQLMKDLNAVSCNIVKVNQLISELESTEHIDSALELSQYVVGDLVASAVKSIQPLAASKNIEIRTACENIHINVDSARIEQTLINVLSNAVKYSPRNTIIDVKALRKAGLMMLEIADLGAGIPDDQKQSVFQRFNRSSNAALSPGYGLGLFITKRTIESHGGTITVVDNKPTGSIFIIALPLNSN